MTHSPSGITEEQQQLYDTRGYFIVDDAIEPGMVEEMAPAATRIKEKVRSGEVDPASSRGEDGETGCILGLFSPEFNEPVFADYIACEPLMRYVSSQIGEELRWAWLSIFTNRRDRDHIVPWHRDVGSGPRHQPEEEELKFLCRPRTECRWEMAMVDDESLAVVQGSQNRYRTELEHEIMVDNKDEQIPGDHAVPLRAGQTLFWNGKMIHRACMKADVERLTIAAAYHQYREDEQPQEVDERQRWMLADHVRDILPEALHIPYDRWRKLQIA